MIFQIFYSGCIENFNVFRFDYFFFDRVYIMSSGPGRIVKELEIEPADRPALEMARVPRFQETVYYIRDLIAQFEAEAGEKSK